MIQKVLYSNDKSSVQILPNNFKDFFTNQLLQENLLVFSKFLNHFAHFMEGKADRVINMTHKYKTEYYFPYYVVVQNRRIQFNPKLKVNFGIYINFNYIEYKNKSGFNYIKYDTEFDELENFVKDIKEEYLSLMEEFIVELAEKFEDMYKNEYSPEYVNLFYKQLFKEYQTSNNIALINLSVTADIHFEDKVSKYIFFDMVKNLRKENYKLMTVENETIFFYPFNRNLQILNKNVPKIRFYDKQKDTIFRYFKKKKDSNSSFLMKSYDDVSMLERFQIVDLVSQDSKKLETDFIEAYTDLNNTIRFEIEYGKKAVKECFKTNLLHDIKINNKQFTDKFLFDFLDMNSTEFKVTHFYDMVTKEKDVEKVKVNFNELDYSGKLTDYYNFILKYHKVLNTIESGNYRQDNSVRSHLKRMRKQGVFRGNGADVVLLQPYKNLLGIYNLNHFYNLLREDRSSEHRKRSGSAGSPD
jgi:hypothetical protein